MNRKILFKVQGILATYLNPEDGALLQGLLENCADYFELVHGCPPAESEAQVLFEDKPPTKTLKDKIVIGLWDTEQKLIGVLDSIKGYPSQSEWFLGLLLIDPAFRQQGLGRKVYEAFEQWITRQGAIQIGLGVVEQNQRGITAGRAVVLRWQRNGLRKGMETGITLLL